MFDTTTAPVLAGLTWRSMELSRRREPNQALHTTPVNVAVFHGHPTFVSHSSAHLRPRGARVSLGVIRLFEPMITKDKMIDKILEVSPLFLPKWEEFLKEWKDEKELPIYLALGDLARHMVALLSEGKDRELREIFKVVEDCSMSTIF